MAPHRPSEVGPLARRHRALAALSRIRRFATHPQLMGLRDLLVELVYGRDSGEGLINNSYPKIVIAHGRSHNPLKLQAVKGELHHPHRNPSHCPVQIRIAVMNSSLPTSPSNLHFSWSTLAFCRLERPP
jgi:hypothetical protein